MKKEIPLKRSKEGELFGMGLGLLIYLGIVQKTTMNILLSGSNLLRKPLYIIYIYIHYITCKFIHETRLAWITHICKH